MVPRSEPGEVFGVEGPRHAPLQQCLSHLGLQHADCQAKPYGRHIIQLRAKAFEACPHETDPPFDFEREVSTFVDTAAQI